LFEKLRVKRLGKQPSEPFQLRVKPVAGPDANLMDVGYGVSQALPIVVDSIRAPNGAVVLVQQPEVHLHPRAQAALGTFFCEMASKNRKRFVIETHSDHLLDRIRIEVANGLIKPEDINIAFLDRDGINVSIHQLSVDKQGNVVNAPNSYRQFFLEEEEKLMLRGS
jgi:predicted ATPase